MLAEIFQNFRNMCLEIYELDPEKVYVAAGLARQKAFKKKKVKLDLLTDVDMLLMVEKEQKYVALFIDMKKLIKIHQKI